jgi:hypothetical protein
MLRMGWKNGMFLFHFPAHSREKWKNGKWNGTRNGVIRVSSVECRVVHLSYLEATRMLPQQLVAHFQNLMSMLGLVSTSSSLCFRQATASREEGLVTAASRSHEENESANSKDSQMCIYIPTYLPIYLI